MLSFRAWIGLGLICLGLVSCATMSPKECRVADWQEIGVTDGLAGKTLTFFNERRLDCEEAGDPHAPVAHRKMDRRQRLGAQIDDGDDGAGEGFEQDVAGGDPE